MFGSLRTRLTVLYAALFAIGLGLVALVVYSAIVSNAGRVVRGELQANATVFDRLWAARSKQMEDGASLLSRDFGFREAVGTKDKDTIASALENLRVRFGIDFAFMVTTDGEIIGADPKKFGRAADDIRHALNTSDDAKGVFILGSTPYQAISAPVLTPTPMGWVVFATRLDRAEMKSLEALSAIPIDAAVLHRDERGRWIEGDGSADPAVSRFIAASLAAKKATPGEIATPTGPAVAVASPLDAMDDGTPVVLMLRYPLARALAPYQPLLGLVLIIGLGALALVVAGSWTLARSVTRPISALEEAARRLREGEAVAVAVTTRDEIGRLADSFNLMSAEIQARETRITHLALHDPDTDLPNRLSIQRGLAALLEAPADDLVVMATLGVDRFDHVRTAIGYGLSDELLGEIGRRLVALAPGMPVARLSAATLGLAFRAENLDAARRMISDLQAALEKPLTFDGTTVDVSLTVGLAAHRVHATSVGDLIERATIAMHQARAQRVRQADFDAAAYGDPAANLSLMSDMMRAMGNGELTIHHQPKLDLRSGQISGVEVLARWTHPTRGPLSPELFVGMAEETGHIRELTEWVMARAISEQDRIVASGRDMTVSINISGRLLSDPDFADLALEVCAKAKAPICFEITETAVIDNPALALEMIDRFAAAGIGVSIDDYGSGVSSLAYLKRIRANELKIDKAFILTMGDSQRDALLVRSTIDLAHGLGLKVTAEGVETAEVLALLTGMGCDVAQGYFTARPMALDALLRFLDQHERPAANEGPAKPRLLRA